MIHAAMVIGPSGNGKSTLAAAIAAELGWSVIEGDDHHPRENLAKMSRGEPLGDADREPFLTAIGRALNEAADAVAACSALKRNYREKLRVVAGKPILFIYPYVPRHELHKRMEAREDHFMPPALLASQLAAFEPPGPDEFCIRLDGTQPLTTLARQAAERLRRSDD